MDKLETQNFALLGTSLGGWVAMLMAAQQPHRIRGVVLNDIGPVVPNDAISRITQYVGRIPPEPSWESAAARVREVYAQIIPGRPDSFWLRHARLSKRATPAGAIVPDMDPAIGTVLRKNYRAAKWVKFLRRFGLMKNAMAFIDEGYWQQFNAMSMPILLLYGEVSDVLPEETVRKMKARQPNMETVKIADRGHAPLLDEPEALAGIDMFLQRLAAGRMGS